MGAVIRYLDRCDYLTISTVVLYITLTLKCNSFQILTHSRKEQGSSGLSRSLQFLPFSSGYHHFHILACLDHHSCYNNIEKMSDRPTLCRLDGGRIVPASSVQFHVARPKTLHHIRSEFLYLRVSR